MAENITIWDIWNSGDNSSTKIGEIESGIATLGYIPLNGIGAHNYVVLEMVKSPLPFYKEQNIAELDIVGRNTPVYQSLSGKGLKYVPVEFTIKHANAYQDILTITGWCDAGNPLWFSIDTWIRKVLIKNFKFEEVKFHNWFECTMELWKYVPIETLKYPRDVKDLRPIADLPVTSPGGSSGKGNDKLKEIITDDEWERHDVWKNSKGEQIRFWFGKKDNKVECVPYTIKEGDTWLSIAMQFYGNKVLSGELDQIATAIYMFNYFNGKFGSDVHAYTELDKYKGKTICIPKKIRIWSNDQYSDFNI